MMNSFPYMVLVSCNSEAGVFTGKADGIRQEMTERCRAIQDFITNPILPGMKRAEARR